MDETGSPRQHRVWMAMGAAQEGTSAIEAAVELARMLDAELAGLFVEDADLLRSAALPFATELTFFSAVRRPLAPPQLERALRAHAETVQRSLAEAARLAGLRWSFRSVRGEMLALALEAAAASDFVVVAAPELAPAIRSARPASSPAAVRSRLIEVQLHDGEEVRRRAGALLERLAALAIPASAAAPRGSTSAFGALRIRMAPRPSDTAGASLLRELLRRGATPLVLV